MSESYESKHWTGDDTREFGIDPDDEKCVVCGAGPLDACAHYCDCDHCMKERQRTAENERRERMSKLMDIWPEGPIEVGK